MHDVTDNFTPPNISQLVSYLLETRCHNKRFSAAGNFFLDTRDLNTKKIRFWNI